MKIKFFEDNVNAMSNTLGFNLNNKLTLMWNVSIQAKTDKGIVTEQLTPTMEIPLNEKYFEIKGNLSQEKKGTIEKTKKVLSPSYNKKIIASWVIEGICIVLLLFMVFFTSPLIITSAHQKKLHRIFKNHGIRMVAVNSDMSQMSNEFVEISSIDDLVKIADDFGRPIFYKNSSNLEEITKFYVVDGGNVFVVDIKEETLSSLPDHKISMNLIRM